MINSLLHVFEYIVKYYVHVLGSVNTISSMPAARLTCFSAVT